MVSLGALIHGSRRLERNPVFSAVFLASVVTAVVLILVVVNARHITAEGVLYPGVLVVILVGCVWGFVPIALKLQRLKDVNPETAEALLERGGRFKHVSDRSVRPKD